MKSYFVTGIDTGVGKTIVSAVLAEALGVDYWKPIQSGDLDNSDSMKVSSLVSDNTTVHPETYRLNTPASPHLSAKLDGVEIEMSNFSLPSVERGVIVEGAGGLCVPLNSQQLIIELIKELAIPTILVTRNYLGSINHTLLSIEALQARAIPIAGVIVNGAADGETEAIIASISGVQIIGHVEQMVEVNRETITAQAENWRNGSL